MIKGQTEIKEAGGGGEGRVNDSGSRRKRLHGGGASSAQWPGNQRVHGQQEGGQVV